MAEDTKERRWLRFVGVAFRCPTEAAFLRSVARSKP
jgi:hypothetical protein